MRSSFCWRWSRADARLRVVSLNLCTDQMLVLLAPRDVAGLTPLARDPALSFVAAATSRLPLVRPDAEAILARHPNLVLSAGNGGGQLIAVLRSARVRVLRVGLPQDFAGIRRETRRIAAALGVPGRGDALIAAMDARLASLSYPVRRRTAIAGSRAAIQMGRTR